MKKLFSILILTGFLSAAIAQTAGESSNFTVKSTPKSVLNNKHLQPGNVIEKFNFKDLNGNTYTLESLKGKVVVLNFWFASCKPCIEEVDKLNALVKKYAKSNVVFLSPTFENADICKRFITKYGLNTIVCPNQKTYAKQLELIYYPTNIVLDKDGFVYKTFSGSTDYIEKVISVELDFLLRM